MTQPYNHQQVEEKWQAFWEKKQLFQDTARQEQQDLKDKMYLLFAFAYPSGSGLHVGHVESKTALDIMARYYRMQGKEVFFPVGWDAFGLPAENYAIKTGVPPAETTRNAINTFRRQLKRIGISYDWANEIATSHPGYYRWTQWIFLQLFNKGLAYKKTSNVNWCPSCQTVLANEQVVDGLCERCDHEVVQKEMEQWFFKITEYSDELISGLEQVDWPEPTKQQQLNWIGKSEGAEITFHSPEVNDDLTVYTTAHDTIYGCTFMVIAPEHAWLKKHKEQIGNWDEVAEYVKKSQAKTELQRQVQKDKTGVLVKGITFTNPVNNEQVPLYVADYVLASYGTGSIMAVPGQDERDYEFAQKFNIPVMYTATREKGNEPDGFINYGDIKKDRAAFFAINSGEHNDKDYIQARTDILDELKKKKVAVKKNQYRLRDWLISRQRYWGAPIPIVYDPEGKPHPVKEEHLPWELPTDVEFKPTGESPLTYSKEFIERTEKLYGKGWRPEFDTMDTFVDSSWYFMRYADARNEGAFAAEEQLRKWLPVDFYMIGPEHIVLHLLYSRFFTKFLRDEGYFDIDEPFAKMRHQGMILGPDHKKMSKSKGNVINPDDIIEKFGADTLRVYEMFMGPIEADKPWDTRAVVGVYKFLQRIYALIKDSAQAKEEVVDEAVRRKIHQTIAKVTKDIPELKFNTAIAAMMECLNEWEKSTREAHGKRVVPLEDMKAWSQIMAPFAPFLAEELYQEVLAGGGSVHQAAWPAWDETLAAEEVVIIPVQVNGKVRAQLEVAAEQVADKALVLEQAKELESLERWLEDKKIRKEIYVPGKILNLVI